MPIGKTEYSFCVKNFLEEVKTGPFHVCVIFNRCLFYSNIVKFDFKKYDREFIDKLNTNVTGFFNQHYIYRTCNTHTEKA